MRGSELVVLGSTTHTGTTRASLLPPLEESGPAGRDFKVAFSPERTDAGRSDFSLRTIPKVVAGLRSLRRALALYSVVCDSPVPVTTLEVAEMT